jgi:sulfur carrier protein ThiS
MKHSCQGQVKGENINESKAVKMTTVRLKLPVWIARMMNVKSSDWDIIERKLPEGATIGSLLSELALTYADFRKAIFDPDAKKVSEELHVVLNDTLLQCEDVTAVKLNDGDMVTIVPVYQGG